MESGIFTFRGERFLGKIPLCGPSLVNFRFLSYVEITHLRHSLVLGIPGEEPCEVFTSEHYPRQHK